MAHLDVSDRPENHIFCRNLDCMDKLKQFVDTLTPDASPNASLSGFSQSGDGNSQLFKTAVEELEGTFCQDVRHICNSMPIGEPVELYQPHLPFQLGVVVPGVTSTFFLPVHPRIRMLQVQCHLNDRPTKFPCQVASVIEHISVSLTPPSGARGDLLISIDTDFCGAIKLAALCYPPTFALPPILVVPPNRATLIPLHGTFPKSITLTIKSNLSTPKVINYTPDMKSIPLEVKAAPEDRRLKVEVFHDGVLMSVSEGNIKVRPIEVSVARRDGGETMRITNNEPFAIKLELETKMKAPLQTMILNLKSGQSHNVKMSHFKEHPRSSSREMKVWLKLTQPVEVLIGSSHLSQSQSRLLRPKLPRFVCFSSGERQFVMIDKTSGELTPWKKLVAIEPCPFIKDFVKVVEDPEDSTNVVLQIAAPDRVVFGRLGFFGRNPQGVSSSTPYGSRCIFIIPEKPRLIILSDLSEGSSERRKLRVENVTRGRVFIKTEAGEVHILAGGTSKQLTMGVGRTISAGSDDLRCIIREKLTQALWAENDPIIGELESNQMMIRFREEGDANYEHILRRIPDKPDALRKLSELLESTLERIMLLEEPETNVGTEGQST